MTSLPTPLGRTVYGQIDLVANGDPLGQAAGWLSRLEPWFGPCNSVSVLARQAESCAVVVVSAGYDDDRAVIVHLASIRPNGFAEEIRIEGAEATLEIYGGRMRLTNDECELDADGIALPQADPKRSALLNDVLAKAMASKEVETING